MVEHSQFKMRHIISPLLAVSGGIKRFTESSGEARNSDIVIKELLIL